MLTDHEKLLVTDFQKRAKGMSVTNLVVGVVGVIAGFVVAPDGGLLAVAAAAMGGGLIGVSLEKRYLAEMRDIILKLHEATKDRPPG